MLSVTGIFKELESGRKSAPMRSFSRVLVIVPAGSGFCIINEQLHVTNATESQTKVSDLLKKINKTRLVDELF